MTGPGRVSEPKGSGGLKKTRLIRLPRRHQKAGGQRTPSDQGDTAWQPHKGPKAPRGRGPGGRGVALPGPDDSAGRGGVLNRQARATLGR